MVLRSLWRLGRAASRLNCSASHHTKSLSFLSCQARMLSFRPIRFFVSQSNTIESLQIRVAQLEKEQGDNSLSLISLYDQLGNAFIGMGDSIIAATYFENAIKIIEKQQQRDLDSLKTRYIDLGSMYLEIKDAGKALKFFEKSLQLAKEMQGDNSKEIAIALNYLSVAHKLNTDDEKYNECLDLALPYMQKNINSNDAQIGLYFIVRSEALALKNKVNESIDCLYTSRKIIERSLGPISNELALIDRNMAFLYLKFGMAKESIDAFERAIHALQTLKIFDESLIELYRNLAYLYKRINNLKKSKETIEKGAEAVKKMKGDKKKLLAIYYNFVGYDFKVLGDIETSKECIHKSL
ncbi:unnamed protein product [Blepharisma stoltei]|uniref:MalT-like TPR region domain-containing protein n=1 Tax=Blepharisma stoltei TaxID=1481888 RepID=A0AAU9I5A9_9CILI|nr:unnamed protein product [Blepharisma stoltei]